MATKLLDDPMAVTSYGSVLVSVTHVLDTRTDPVRALEHALRLGRPIFIGVALSKAECAAASAKLEHALAEIVSAVDYRERG